jgi:beta-lactamase regulating signal transducer with metallopeptidase domain
MRLLAFALFVLGGFTMGYDEAMQSIAPSINKVVASAASTQPALSKTIQASVTSYIQQNVTPTADPYLAIGVAIAIGGLALLVVEDRKSKSSQQNAPLPTQPMSLKQQE